MLIWFVCEQGNILQQIISPWFILECINTVPFIITVSISSLLYAEANNTFNVIYKYFTTKQQQQ